MFFVAKATLCIGLVAVAASQAGGPGLATHFDGDARAAAASAGRACLASSACLSVGAGVLAAATSGGAIATPGVDAPRSRPAKLPIAFQRAPERAALRTATRG